jgi:heme/copper-type cytochrome/quinol oxidase subunit 2
MYATSGLSFLAFFFLLVIWIGLFLTWSISIWDIFRRHDLRGIAKAGWFVLVIVIPFIGTVIYLMVRPRHLDAHVNADQVEGSSPLSAAQQLETLARLHDAGHLTDEEFARQKAKLS